MNPNKLVTVEDQKSFGRENLAITTAMDDYSQSFHNPLQHAMANLPNLSSGTPTQQTQQQQQSIDVSISDNNEYKSESNPKQSQLDYLIFFILAQNSLHCNTT